MRRPVSVKRATDLGTLVERFSGVGVIAAAAVPLTVMGAMNRYPRRGRVSTKRGFSDESPGASELQKRLWPDTFVDVDHNLNTENCARQGGVCATPATAVIDTQ